MPSSPHSIPQRLGAPPRKLSARRGSSSAGDPYACSPASPASQLSSILTIVKVNPETADNRISFATSFSSFGRGGRGRGGAAPRNGSPDSPRPGSPRRKSFGHGTAYAEKPNLSPDELYQLAKHSVEPTSDGAPQVGSSTYAPSERSHSRSPARSPARSSHARASSHSSIKSTSSSVLSATPATFTPLDDGIFLPFIDRPSEVTQLITTLPTL